MDTFFFLLHIFCKQAFLLSQNVKREGLSCQFDKPFSSEMSDLWIDEQVKQGARAARV